jgi:hypothetical protein
VYRPCIASFDADLQEPETNTMGSKLKDHFEPYWDDKKDWLCTVEFLPRDDPEARSFSAEIIGYLFGYAHLTNARSLALLGDPDANAYELLFSFSSPQEKQQFLDLVRYNDDMAMHYFRGTINTNEALHKVQGDANNVACTASTTPFNTKFCTSC